MRKLLLILTCMCISTGAFAKDCPTIWARNPAGRMESFPYPTSLGKTLKDHCLKMNDSEYLLTDHAGANTACDGINKWVKDKMSELRAKGYSMIRQEPTGKYAMTPSSVCSALNGEEGSCPALKLGEDVYAWVGSGKQSTAHQLMEEQQKNRGYHVLLSDGVAYHYERNRKSVPLCQ